MFVCILIGRPVQYIKSRSCQKLRIRIHALGKSYHVKCSKAFSLYNLSQRLACIVGYVGDMGAEMQAFLELKETLPDRKEILKNPAKAPIPKVEGKLKGGMDKEEKQYGSLYATIGLLISMLQEDGISFKKLLPYIRRIDKQFLPTFIKLARPFCERDEEYMEFIREHNKMINPTAVSSKELLKKS